MTGFKWLAAVGVLTGWALMNCLPACAVDAEAASDRETDLGSLPQNAEIEQVKAEDSVEVPWDFDPYRVLAWIVSEDPTINAASVETPLKAYLDREFSAVWRFEIADAPAAVHTAAIRDIGGMSFNLITASDPVLVVKRDHPDAVRIRIAENVGQYVKKVYATKERVAETKRRAAAIGNETLDGVDERLEVISGDALAVRDLWAKPETEALLVSRGMALTLKEPEAKIVTLPIEGLVSETIEKYDKIFIVRINSRRVPIEVEVTEFDTLMHHFGPVARTEASSENLLHVAVGGGLSAAFAPVVRIENAGQKSAIGLLRAGGFILERDRESSPAAVRVGDVLEPMIRKDDRNGKPILIGPMDWAYLNVTALTGDEGRHVEMDFYAGRAGGLQGRKNSRTFRMALRVRPFLESTLLRLHLQRKADFPLIGYELYDKELDSTNMTFLGRTDWNGRVLVERSDKPLRLLYVKNGGAVLARLPIVPGLYRNVVADLSGDDLRLQAEAYIRGVQNSIVDLIAIRKLFEARIHLRLERGEMDKAQDLLNALRDQPTSDKLYDDIGKKHAAFINQLGSGNANQRRKVDEMFSVTRELLAKHITPMMIRDLESTMRTAAANGGRLPAKAHDAEAEESESESTASSSGNASSGNAPSDQPQKQAAGSGAEPSP